MLFLLVFTCISCLYDRSLAAVYASVLSDDKPSCLVLSPFKSPLVSAYLEQEVTSSGCVTNATTAKVGAEVHIISYHSNRDHNLELNLKDHEANGFSRPFIIILSSNVRVHWQVRLKRNPTDLMNHTFVASKGSGIRFANKRLESRPTLRKPKLLPTDDDELMSYVKKHFGAITSFTKLQGGDSINLVIGRAESPSTSSSLSTTSSPSSVSSSSPPCSIQDGHKASLSASGITQTPRDVEVCLVDSRRDSFAKYAYVVELKHVQYKKPFEVNLEIRHQSRQSVDKVFTLVLKSPSHVTWRVHTRKVQGYIHIVANSFVDMSGIRMHTVAVRSEELATSGMELLEWVKYYLGPVVMYASMNNTNNIQITLPQMYTANVKDPLDTPQKPTMGPEWGTAKHIKATLKRALRTECDRDSVTVAVDKNVLQMLGIKKSTVTLIDSQCKVVENSTHVYIQSTSQACGTNDMESQLGKKTYINTLVIHNSNTITEESKDADNSEDLETEGSGMEDIFSGSGEQEATDIILDDEDLELRPLQIRFTCTIDVPQNEVEVISPKEELPVDVTFQLQLFQSILFMVPYLESHVQVVHPQGRLYLQASVKSQLYLRAHMQHCWLSQGDDEYEEGKYFLVKNGCGVEDSVTYPVMPDGLSMMQSERLTFSLEKYGKLTSSTEVFLKCQLTVCCINRHCGGQTYPVCEDNKVCETKHRRHDHMALPQQLMVLGPIDLPESIRKYSENVDHSRGNSESAGDASQTRESTEVDKQDQVIIEGLDSGTVVGIAFAAFIIGVLMMGSLWFIHTHSGSLFTSGPFKRSMGNRGSTENEADYGETTPGSSAPIST